MKEMLFQEIFKLENVWQSFDSKKIIIIRFSPKICSHISLLSYYSSHKITLSNFEIRYHTRGVLYSQQFSNSTLKN